MESQLTCIYHAKSTMCFTLTLTSHNHQALWLTKLLSQLNSYLMHKFFFNLLTEVLIITPKCIIIVLTESKLYIVMQVDNNTIMSIASRIYC